MKHHVVIVYQTVPPQGISYQTCRNLLPGKYIYTLTYLMSLAHLKIKIINKKLSENRNYFIYIFFVSCCIVYNAYIEE